jgi:hypothetical protein
MNYPIEAALIIEKQLAEGKDVNMSTDEALALVRSYLGAKATAWSLSISVNTLQAELDSLKGGADLATAPQPVANRGKNSLYDAYQPQNIAEEDGA